jgi:WD repeat-containing protein 92
MDTTSAPQIIEHIHQPLLFTPFDVKWLKNSAKLVVVGQYPKATGAVRLYELETGKLKELHAFEHKEGIKCSSMYSPTQIITGDFKGNLVLYDLQSMKVQQTIENAHSKIINSIDTCSSFGPSEVLTGSRDGSVKLWDLRQPHKPVLSLEPPTEATVDCWSVAFGNAFSNNQRALSCGFDNGDIKIFDLNAMQLKWEDNCKNGVTHIQFDRKDIAMNKLYVSLLEAKFRVYDLKTYHPEKGFACTEQNVSENLTGSNVTVWGSYVLPQNREIFCVNSGSDLKLYKYHYPHQRKRKTENDNLEIGVPGSVEILNENNQLGTQPCVGFDWHPNKCGLAAMASLDQSVRIIVSTKLDLF